jgi:hypothetical protein
VVKFYAHLDTRLNIVCGQREYFTRRIPGQSPVLEMTMGATAKHAARHTSVASLTQKLLTSTAILQFIRSNSVVLTMRCIDGSGGKSG